MINVEEILTAIIKADYETLIDYLSEREIEKYRIKTELVDYEWVGVYETDARYTYPNCEHLIITVLSKLLKEKIGQMTCLPR